MEDNYEKQVHGDLWFWLDLEEDQLIGGKGDDVAIYLTYQENTGDIKISLPKCGDTSTIKFHNNGEVEFEPDYMKRMFKTNQLDDIISKARNLKKENDEQRLIDDPTINDKEL